MKLRVDDLDVLVGPVGVSICSASAGISVPLLFGVTQLAIVEEVELVIRKGIRLGIDRESLALRDCNGTEATVLGKVVIGIGSKQVSIFRTTLMRENKSRDTTRSIRKNTVVISRDILDSRNRKKRVLRGILLWRFQVICQSFHCRNYFRS